MLRQYEGKQPKEHIEHCNESCSDVVLNLNPREPRRTQNQKEKNSKKNNRKKGQHFPFKTCNFYIPSVAEGQTQGLDDSVSVAELFDENENLTISRMRKTRKVAIGRAPPKKNQKRTALPPLKVAQRSTKIYPKDPRRADPTPAQEKDARLRRDEQPVRSGAYLLKFRCKKKP